MKKVCYKLFIFSLILLVQSSYADEIRPGYLELNEESNQVFLVLWKIPQKNAQTQVLSPKLPESCENKSEINTQFMNGTLLQRWYIHCDTGLVGRDLSINNISRNNTDVLLRIKWLDSSVSTALLKPSEPIYRIPEKSSNTDIAITYLGLGISHILLGLDHLLFVFALLLIVHNTRRLVMTITSFTLAHSITLGAATLGLVHVPQQPVEAVIALSILFLAVELRHSKQGRIGAAERWPWMIAFLFGLLHGFGFAGALAEIGLPEQAIPLTLIFFNIGVEIGQLIFVAAVLVSGWLLRQLMIKISQVKRLEQAENIAIYAIGSLSSLWLFERMSTF
ncbi:HupE/UreJ family protein [sulfur-oxidizing endosymbiont of Gigantopelta aegis]|uniref:HupE/UreJ family protein n=1 Tax=sulfur-oxidizing endosymbiont of Gigantopelta aegis TaxID=2794934 RepID=UPI0018DB893C|nr:HupE/UreJ family protein [sulfur-oxidizing endosymbiont of Gigantopelta aegis]